VGYDTRWGPARHAAALSHSGADLLVLQELWGWRKERHAGLVVNLYSSSSTPAPEWWVPKNGNGNESIEGALPVRNGSIATLSDPPPGRHAGTKGAKGTGQWARRPSPLSIHPSIDKTRAVSALYGGTSHLPNRSVLSWYQTRLL
jgi:hypothetical protein